MKPRATFHWHRLPLWCAATIVLWLAAFAFLRALGLAPWQALAFLALVPGVVVVWGVTASGKMEIK